MLGRGWEAHSCASYTWQLCWSHQSRTLRSCCNDCRLHSWQLHASIRRPASSDRNVRYSSTGLCRFYLGCLIHWANRANWLTADGFWNERKYDSSEEICEHGRNWVQIALQPPAGAKEWVLSCAVTLDICLKGCNKMAPLPSRRYYLAPRSPLPRVKLPEDATCGHPWLAAAHSAVLTPSLTCLDMQRRMLGQVQRWRLGSPENYHLHPLLCVRLLACSAICSQFRPRCTFVPPLSTSCCQLFRFKDHRLFLSDCLHIFCHQNFTLAVNT